MAQGDKWRIAVAVEIPNYSFKFPSLFSSTLSSNYTSGTRIYVADTSPDFDKILKIGDKITVGASSYSGSTGAVETAVVSGVDSATPPVYIDISAALTYDYSSGDSIGGVGTAKAAGFETVDTGMDCGGIDNSDGKDDKYCQKLTTSGNAIFAQSLGVLVLLPSTVYRHGIWCKGTASGANSVYVWDADGNWKWALTLDTQASWTEKYVVATSASSGTRITEFGIWVNAGSSLTSMMVDCWYMQHAKGSSGAATGYYEIDAYPDVGSFTWGYMNEKVSRRCRNGKLKTYYASGFGERSRKIGLKAHFSGVSQTVWNELMLFLDWQEKGNLLNLFPFIDSLPPFIQGEMSIENITKDIWDLAVTSFDLIFMEA